MIILSTRDTKNISVIDLDTLSEVENIDLKSFAHCIQLVNGKLLAASFHGQVIDIFGIGKCNTRKFKQGVLQRIKSLDTGSPVYCMELVQNGGLLIIGQFEGFVDIIDIDNYKSVYQARVPSERCVRQITKTLGGLSEFCFATDCGLFFGKLHRNPMKFKFEKNPKYFEDKLINKFYEFKTNWFMVFEQSQMNNKFYILSRVQKQVVQEFQLFDTIPNCIEPKLECYGIISVPEATDLYFIKHQNGLFLFETRKMRIYNLQKMFNQIEGWSFSELI